MDLALTYRSDLDTLDLSVDVATADLAREDSLTAAVLLSLQCDRLAELPDVPGGADRRGWWADSLATTTGDRFGSRLWLLEREKQLPAVVARARSYIEEALAWLVDDGFASEVLVTAFVLRPSVLAALVQIELAGGAGGGLTGQARYRFEWADSTQRWVLKGEGL